MSWLALGLLVDTRVLASFCGGAAVSLWVPASSSLGCVPRVEPLGHLETLKEHEDFRGAAPFYISWCARPSAPHGSLSLYCLPGGRSWGTPLISVGSATG